MTLDMDIGTMAFARNGHDLGVAVEGLSGELSPAFSVYNKDDQITLAHQVANAGIPFLLSAICGQPFFDSSLDVRGSGS